MFYRIVLTLIAIFMALPLQLSAQGIFVGFGVPKSVAATGQTEVLGTVIVGLSLGTTSADTFVIDVSPLVVTNTNTTDVRVVTSGNISTGATAFDTDRHQVRIPVNVGGTSGSIRVDGIRVAMAGTGATSVTARLSWGSSQNLFNTGASVVVVDRVASGLLVDPMTDTFRIFNNTVFDNTATVAVHEGFNSAFVNSTDFGQTAPTQIRIRVSDFPVGLRMQFPASITANETTATLTTSTGGPVELPLADGSTEVFYRFNSAANSADVVESFNVAFTVAIAGTVQLLQPTIEASLYPIGAATPTTTLPSTAIPRFSEQNLAVLEGTSRIVTKTFYWTGIDGSRENHLFMLNPSSNSANLTLTAFDAAGQTISGTNITNSVSQTLTTNQSSDRVLTDIFGSGATNIATVQVQSTSSELLALETVIGSGGLESTPLLDRGTHSFVLPSLNENEQLSLFNPSSSRISGTVTLLTVNGVLVASKTIDLDPKASTSRSLQDLLGSQAEGQVVGNFTGEVVVFESFGSPNSLNLLGAQAPSGGSTLYVPFVVVGSGYESDLSLINVSGRTATVLAQLFDSQGTLVGSGQIITFAPSEQVLMSVRNLFHLQNNVTGYIRLQVSPVTTGPFGSYPAITGHIRIRTGSGSTAFPITGSPLRDAFLLNSGVPTGQFQGISLVNPNSQPVTVTLQSLSSSGTVLGTATINVGAGQVVAKLTTELFSVAIPERSVIRVTSSAPILSTSVTGSFSGDLLRSVPPLR